MRTKHMKLPACLAITILASGTLHSQIVDEVKDRAKNPAEIKANINIDGGGTKADANGKAGSKAEANNAGSHSESKSVSVTSDGNKTIRKTVTTRNGVTEEKTEVLDGNGKVIEDHGPGNAKPDGTTKPGGVLIGAEVKAADPALRDQLGLGPEEGVVIRTLAPQGPAAKAGLKVNDILLKAGDQVLAEEEDLRSELRNLKAGDTLELEYLRKGERGTVTVTVEERGDRQQQGGGAGAGGGKGGGTLELQIDGASDLDKVLDDPNVPEAVKKQMKEMLEKMKNLPK
jgi:hypothetical protein